MLHLQTHGPDVADVSANVTVVALISGRVSVGLARNAAIGVVPFGYISNCPSKICDKPDAANGTPTSPEIVE